MKYLVLVTGLVFGWQNASATLSDVKVKKGPELCSWDTVQSKDICMSYSRYKKHGGKLSKSELNLFVGRSSLTDWSDDGPETVAAISASAAMADYYKKVARSEYAKAVDRAEKAVEDQEKVVDGAQKNLNKLALGFEKSEHKDEPWIDSNLGDYDAESTIAESNKYLTGSKSSQDEAKKARDAAKKLQLEKAREKAAEKKYRYSIEEEKRARKAAKVKLSEERQLKEEKEEREEDRKDFALLLKGTDVETKLDSLIKHGVNLQDRANQISRYYNDTLMGLFVRMKLKQIESNFCDQARMCVNDKTKKKSANLGLQENFKVKKSSRWNRKFKSSK